MDDAVPDANHGAGQFICLRFVSELILPIFMAQIISMGSHIFYSPVMLVNIPPSWSVWGWNMISRWKRHLGTSQVKVQDLWYRLPPSHAPLGYVLCNAERLSDDVNTF